ncbi:MAG: septation protein SpoVG family protein [Candidatus Omnitrophica bacterium]|nr:septation protein SpoVG family protein [Candidatus Omnitrophota bacterium]
MSEQTGVAVKRINRFKGEGTTRAFCDVAIAESFLIKGIKVIEGKNGLFVSMPREQGKDGNWYDTVIPLTKEARALVSEAVLCAYESQET